MLKAIPKWAFNGLLKNHKKKQCNPKAALLRQKDI